MGGGSKNKQTTQVTTASPWTKSVDTLLDAQGNLESAANTQQFYFPGSTVADSSPETLAAQQAILNRAADGSPVVDAAGNQIQSTLAGDYFNTPGQATFQNIANGGAANPAVQYIEPYAQGGYADPSSAFYANQTAGGLDNTNAAASYQPFTQDQFTAAEQYLTGTAQGNWLNNNPYVDAMLPAVHSGLLCRF